MAQAFVEQNASNENRCPFNQYTDDEEECQGNIIVLSQVSQH
jgi:hypothetical protein